MVLFSSPLEQFEVTSFLNVNLTLLGLNFALTNLGLYALLVLMLSISVHVLAANDRRLVPSRWSVGLESAYASLHGMVKEQVGSSNERYLPFIYALFFFVILANLAGNVPYSFTISTSAVLSIGLSFTIFFAVTVLGLHKHGLHFFAFFVPAGTPLAMVPLLVLIELISYLARAFSLGVRLFANMVAGHTLLKILSGMLWPILTSGLLMFVVALIPMSIFLALVGLEVAVSVIQAYVFVVLTCVYLRDAIDLH
uniref:ATP synthase subunit a n=1 Tax=Rhodotorula toruloides (strain NP11) TaxID=1130832 RepID=A0A7G8ZGE2_RHOT1|nr:ATP synthase F0 subunit a [Rhodotorula toruloides]QNL17827.1 ATP synthase F0 subunit a [Rhodotorula toruloides]CAE5968152.1 ATP synthase F0 subunit a [Rhodotorula toruloides]